jgi:DNA polymerase-3 subunit epsilon
MILFFDTETTGLPDYRMPPEHECQPSIVQIAMSLTDDAGTERASASMVVQVIGREIPTAASKVHGITTQMAAEFGVFGEEHSGAHDALADLRACARLYFHLQSSRAAA